MDQPSLFDMPPPPAPDELGPEATIDERFWAFHHHNPHVLALFARYVRQLRDAGFTRYSMKTLVERVRWHEEVETRRDRFLLNNDFTARYARLLMDEGLAPPGFFHLRALRS